MHVEYDTALTVQLTVQLFRKEHFDFARLATVLDPSDDFSQQQSLGVSLCHNSLKSAHQNIDPLWGHSPTQSFISAQRHLRSDCVTFAMSVTMHE